MSAIIERRTQGIIYLILGGRLGNQLFRYSFARALQLKYFPDYKLEAGFVTRRPITEERKRFGLQNSLVNFRIENTLVEDTLFTDKRFSENFTSMQKLIFSFYRVAIKTLPPKLLPFIKSKTFRRIANHYGLYIALPASRYEKIYITNGRNILCDSEFEAHEYFDDIKDILLREFTPIHDVLPHNKELMNDIESSESVCVHIRRGDFLESENSNICGVEYFSQAMKEIHAEIPDCKFFVFSDDVELVKKTMPLPYDIVYESGNNPSYETLRLMYSCKHFIMSNSTFSWWAQYLSRNPNKIVYAPSRWRLNDNCSGLDLPYMRRLPV